MVDNFEQIIELLDIKSEDDNTYFVQILQRKKDVEKLKDPSSHIAPPSAVSNNNRTIKSYYVRSKEYLTNKESEIKAMCDLFKARAMISLNKKSLEKAALHTLRKVTDQIINEDYKNVKNAYSSVMGRYSNESKKNKKWIIDIDEDNEVTVEEVIEKVNELKPDGNKHVATIPSNSGYHVITNPFDVKTFSEDMPGIEVHKKTPTNLYIPDFQ